MEFSSSIYTIIVVLIGTAIGVVIAYYLVRQHYLNKIKLITGEIDKSLKKRIGEALISEQYDLDGLERSVKRLINEKTSEIDNLKELERFRKEFLGNVAHELRSPIFNIQGYVYTLLEGAMTDEEVNMKFLQKAARNIDHISSLVEDLVTISMIESGEVQIEYSSFNIKELVKEVIEFLDLPARGRNIHLHMKTNTENDLYVNADRQKIKQVLINLIGNSIKYGRDNGSTTISLEDLHQQVSIEVSDNGEGISPEHLPRIFERFYREDKSRSRSQSGTGLGLSIVKHFIEAHKQKIIVSSVPGIGSIFSFTLDKSK